MKMRLLPKLLLLSTVVLLLASVTGVCATWTYANPATDMETETGFALTMSEYIWDGAEDLEGGTGEDHSKLIDAIINHKQYGLNTKNSYLNNQINDRSSSWLFSSDTLGSMDFWEREDIANYFSEETEGLEFLLYFPDGVSDTYYLYTTTLELGESNAPNFAIGSIMYRIYRTTITKNEHGVYEAVKSELGYAKSAYYSNPITGSAWLKYPSFDPASWTAGKRGTGKADAILTYVGQTDAAYPETKTEEVYYTFTNGTAATRTITLNTTDTNCKVYVYDSSMKLVSETSGAQGSLKMSWSAKRNTVYYLVMSGGLSIPYTLT